VDCGEEYCTWNPTAEERDEGYQKSAKPRTFHRGTVWDFRLGNPGGFGKRQKTSKSLKGAARTRWMRCGPFSSESMPYLDYCGHVHFVSVINTIWGEAITDLRH
jgi:hypothetical protein